MAEQKYFIGDRVCIRPFDEIDRSELGPLDWAPDSCFGIDRASIAEISEGHSELVVIRADPHEKTHAYRLADPGSNNPITFWWAQGMLYPLYTEELPDIDPRSLGDLFTP